LSRNYRQCCDRSNNKAKEKENRTFAKNGLIRNKKGQGSDFKKTSLTYNNVREVPPRVLKKSWKVSGHSFLCDKRMEKNIS